MEFIFDIFDGKSLNIHGLICPCSAMATSLNIRRLYFCLHTNIHPRDAGIVVGDLLVVRDPRGEVDVLVLGLAGQAG